MIRRASAYLDQRPLLAVVLGLLTAFLILYFATPSLFDGADQPQYHSKGAV
ncbi:hypothetical protein SAMN05445504_2409 [Burkholderia sp. CF099]|nr:hypothetical protein SAMN05445504_2409 [Burkholderia sp. CF099]